MSSSILAKILFFKTGKKIHLANYSKNKIIQSKYQIKKMIEISKWKNKFYPLAFFLYSMLIVDADSLYLLSICWQQIRVVKIIISIMDAFTVCLTVSWLCNNMWWKWSMFHTYSIKKSEWRGWHQVKWSKSKFIFLANVYHNSLAGRRCQFSSFWRRRRIESGDVTRSSDSRSSY
jgi:hypothetical protein